MTTCDLLIQDVTLATMRDHREGPNDCGVLDDAALAVRDGRIAWLGPARERPTDLDARATIDGAGRLLTPGLIDCHTHLVWAGDRIDEFEKRLEGVSYAEIAHQGGGIASTVRATRAASTETLYTAAAARMDTLVREGVTRVEVKSGYGLELDTERRMLQTARRLGARGRGHVHTTFLGAHAVPTSHTGDADGYVDTVCEQMLPTLVDTGLVDAVDAFCESIAFSPEQVERVFRAARTLGVPIKLHAEQLSNLGGAALAARYGALSADHLEYLDEEGVRAMAEAGTTAVLLPGAFYFLNETRRPPVDLLRHHGVPIAVATDLNPGSSPIHDLRTALNMSCVLFGLTPTEALRGATTHAARALGVHEETGSLEIGKLADLALWNVERPAALVATLGQRLCATRFVAGRAIDEASA